MVKHKELNVQVESSGEWCPQGLALRPELFKRNMETKIEGTLSKFADGTRLCRAVNTLEGRCSIQRALDRLERWGCVNDMTFNKAKCKAKCKAKVKPVPGSGQFQTQTTLGGELIESRPEEKDLGVLENQKKCDQQVEGGDSPSLLLFHETPPGQLHPSLGPPA